MRMWLVVVILAAPLSARPAQPGAVIEDELAPKRKRAAPLVYAMYAPVGHKGDKPVPLIIAVHGGRGTAKHFVGFLRSVAEANGAILAGPQGFREIVGAEGYWWKGDAADLAAIDRLIEHIKKNNKIDPKKITLIGLADGAELALKWAFAKKRDLQGVIAVNFLWKGITPRLQKGLKLCLFASRDAKEKRASLRAHAEKAQKALERAKMPAVLRIMAGSSRSFFHGWDREFRKAYRWFDDAFDWPKKIASQERTPKKPNDG